MMNLQVGVKILLKNKDEKYLLVRRSMEKYPETKGEAWDIVGGRIEPGVILLENLKREVKEETGLELNGEPHFIFAQDIFRPDKHIVRLTYLGEADGEVKLDTSENDQHNWFSREEIEKMEDINHYFKELIPIIWK